MKIKTKYLVFIALLLLVLILIVAINKNTTDKKIRKFSSDAELEKFLEERMINLNYFSGTSSITKSFSDSTESSRVGQSYSSTNVQVDGVDESDIVKNDGRHIYVLSNSNLSIILAYPPEDAEILSTIDINGTGNSFFINKNKVIVFGQEFYKYDYGCTECNFSDILPATSTIQQDNKIYSERMFVSNYILDPKSFIKIYDVSDKRSPKIISEILYDGWFFGSRMIDNKVYVIANQPIIKNDEGKIILPSIKENGRSEVISSEEIYYFSEPNFNYQLTTVFSIDIDNNEVDKESFLVGNVQTIYVSDKNIYLASPKYIDYIELQKDFIKEVLLKFLDSENRTLLSERISLDNDDSNNYYKLLEIFSNYYNSLSTDEKEAFEKSLISSKELEDFTMKIIEEYQKTEIYKISIEDKNVRYVGKGEVSGYLINQFSLDEYQGFLRVATTLEEQFAYFVGIIPFNLENQQTDLLEEKNNVYILNRKMNIVGKLENLASSEKIYSTRFIGDKLYMITFRQIDPFFVIDLSDKTAPKILGELKIPGFSTYLHPFDDKTIIGIGMDTIEESGRVIPSRLKLSIFDVSEPDNPREIDKYIIGDFRSESIALYEHKSFFFNKEKGIIAIPVSVIERTDSNERSLFGLGKTSFQGAYVFDISKENGFSLKGKITHLNETEKQKIIDKDYYFTPYDSYIQRILYINDTLYTISYRKFMMNDIKTLEEIKFIDLPNTEQFFSIYDIGGFGIVAF